MRFVSLIALILALPLATLAQNGTLRGTIYDANNGETLIGASVVVKSIGTGTATDFEGEYSLSLPAGTYDVEVSSLGFEPQVKKGVIITDGEVTLLDVTLGTSVLVSDVAVVEARQITNTENAMLTMQRKSANTIDGLSSQAFRRVGDADAGAALKRIPGVAVQGGKEVFVRGLGDRYTKTLLNGMAIPGLDPDRNTVQVDIFPTNLIDNMVVYKTFSPDLPGDFVGGLVDIGTKSFPDEKSVNIKYSLGHRPGMTLNGDFLLYEGGKLDLLGFDDGGRDPGVLPGQNIPDPVTQNPGLEVQTRRFGKIMAASRQGSFLNQSVSFSAGNQIKKEESGRTFGFNAMANYRLNYTYFEEVEFGRYIKRPASEDLELNKEEVRKGELGRREAQWSALLNGAMKTKNSSYAINLFRTQGALAEASDRVSENFEQTGAILLEDILTFTERSMTNMSIKGEHYFDTGAELEWTSSTSLSTIQDPDFRITSLSVTTGDTTLAAGDGATIARYFRDLREWNQSMRADLTIPMEFWGSEGKLKFGANNVYRTRDYEILPYTFDYRITGSGQEISGDPNWFFEDENIWTPESGIGTFVVSTPVDSANIFTARQNILAVYAMNELPVNEIFKVVYGVRAEKTDMFYTGQNQSGTRKFNDDKTLNELDILPSVNLVYNMTERMNLRGSFNRTLARPSFKEKSIAQIFDPITKRTFIGNIDLEETRVMNYDARWEFFPRLGEVISASAFYKQFQGHIEVVSFEAAPDNVQPINAGSSSILGAELEIRKQLDFVSDTVQTWNLGGNVTFIRSRVNTDEVILPSQTETEFEIRQANARSGETVTNTRVMAGQAPYLVNGYLNYRNTNNGIEANVSYNVQGKSLAIVGMGRVPDVFQQPFHSLNLKASKSFGEDNNQRVSLRIQNLLDAQDQQLYESFGATSQIYSIFTPGRTFTASYSITL